MKFRPVFVVGTGRSGTSLTAKVLHEELGINMGSEFNPGSVDGKGTYEDRALYGNDHHLANGDITLPFYLKCLRGLLKARIEDNVPWGYKSPMFCHVLPYYLEQIYPMDPVIVVATRPLQAVIKSCLNRYKNWTSEMANREIPMRMKLIQIHLQNRKYHHLDYSEYREESWVKSELQKILSEEDLAISGATRTFTIQSVEI